MQNFKKQLIVILSCALMFNAPAVYAQEAAPAPAQPGTTPPPADSELSLENELNQAQTPAPGTTVPTSEPIPAEATMQTPTEPTTNVSDTQIVSNDEPNDLEEIYAMNGWSFGATAFIQNYNVDAEMQADDGSDAGRKIDLSSKSADFQSLGVMARYAVLPINRIGTDLNISLGNSINHGSVNFTSITVARAEVNLGYTIDFGKTNAAYFLAGGGYEIVYGQDINRLVVPGGGLFQVGAGMTFNKKISLEAFYSYASHRVANRYLNEASNAAGVATNFELSANKVTSNVIQGRLLYAF